jgi:hypothetical protein
MRLRLERLIKTEKNTIGKLYIDYQQGMGWQYFCDTLEDCERLEEGESGVKIYGKTAIPKGVYRCLNVYSEKFQMITPLLQNVKYFTGVRIHSGNTENDTEGCILIGTAQGSKLINSRIAYNNLWNILQKQKAGYDLEII